MRELGLAVVQAVLQTLAVGLPWSWLSPQQLLSEPWGTQGPTSSAHPWPESLRLVPD